jgi:hypothetical protein
MHYGSMGSSASSSPSILGRQFGCMIVNPRPAAGPNYHPQRRLQLKTFARIDKICSLENYRPNCEKGVIHTKFVISARSNCNHFYEIKKAQRFLPRKSGLKADAPSCTKCNFNVSRLRGLAGCCWVLNPAHQFGTFILGLLVQQTIPTTIFTQPLAMSHSVTDTEII